MCVVKDGTKKKQINGWKLFQIDSNGKIIGLCHQLSGTQHYDAGVTYKSVPCETYRADKNPGFQGFVRKSDAMKIAEYWRQGRAPMYVVLKVVFFDAYVGRIENMTSLADGMTGIAGAKMRISSDPGLFYFGIRPTRHAYCD